MRECRLQLRDQALLECCPNGANLFGGDGLSPYHAAGVGRGGVGRNDQHDTVNAGGNGGPGIIQIHVPASQQPLLNTNPLLLVASPPAIELLPIL